MNGPLDVIVIILTVIGAFFYFAGTLGVLRFPDTLSRLHALTKADNLGLGFIALGVMTHSLSITVTGKILLIWILVLFSSATACYLISQRARSCSSTEQHGSGGGSCDH